MYKRTAATPIYGESQDSVYDSPHPSFPANPRALLIEKHGIEPRTVHSTVGTSEEMYSATRSSLITRRIDLCVTTFGFFYSTHEVYYRILRGVEY